jgi:hypothetical protein
MFNLKYFKKCSEENKNETKDYLMKIESLKIELLERQKQEENLIQGPMS